MNVGQERYNQIVIGRAFATKAEHIFDIILDLSPNEEGKLGQILLVYVNLFFSFVHLLSSLPIPNPTSYALHFHISSLFALFCITRNKRTVYNVFSDGIGQFLRYLTSLDQWNFVSVVSLHMDRVEDCEVFPRNALYPPIPFHKI